MTLNYTPEQTKMLIMQAMEDPEFVAELKAGIREPPGNDHQESRK